MSAGDATSRAPDLGRAQFSALAWIEPVIIVGAMITALIVNRRKNYSIIPRSTPAPQRYRSPDGSSRSSEDTLVDPQDFDAAFDSDESSSLQPAKRTRTPSPYPEPIGRFSNNIHSRILQKFPFLVEMFYWALNYVAYRVSKDTAASLHGRKGNAVVQLAQDHGIDILKFEHDSLFSFLFLLKETTVQRFFLDNHVGMMTIINQVYSMVHIPGTVAFICWYYYAAPSFSQFAVARRTMALGNFVAFAVFAVYPCMPPRLLPERFGFEDTVRQAHAESVWVGENGESGHFNQLAAMPSLHFTYALIIGCAIFWHSGFLQSLRGKSTERNVFSTMSLMLAGAFYPALVLLVIVATANHYYLDAVAAAFSVAFCFLSNRIWLVLLPAERLLGRLLRVEKPIPTTGQSGRKSRSRGKDGGEAPYV